MRRFVNRSRKPRKDSRTYPVPAHQDFGAGQDVDKYFRCWNCGVINDITRNSLGGSRSKSGVAYSIYPATFSSDNNNTTDGDELQIGDVIHGENQGVALLNLLPLRTGHVIMEEDAAGDAKSVRVNWQPKIVGGCWFCGCKNYKGKH